MGMGKFGGFFCNFLLVNFDAGTIFLFEETVSSVCCETDRGIWFYLFQSYGGFVTTHVLGNEQQDVFSCGVAVAPVTDWRYYGR